MPTQQSVLFLTTACSDCGKRYNVPADKAGKRAKCKVCGNTFTVTAVNARKPAMAIAKPEPARVKTSHLVKPKPVMKSIPAVRPAVRPSTQPKPVAPQRPRHKASPPPPPEAAKLRFADHDIVHALTMSGKVGAGAKGFTELSPAQRMVRRVFDALLKFQTNMWVLLACLAAAATMGCFIGFASPMHKYPVFGFPALAGVLLVSGLTSALVSAKLSPSGFVVPWKNIFKVIFLSAGVAMMAGVFYLIAWSLRDAPPAGELDMRLQNHPQLRPDKELPQHLKGHTAH